MTSENDCHDSCLADHPDDDVEADKWWLGTLPDTTFPSESWGGRTMGAVWHNHMESSSGDPWRRSSVARGASGEHLA